MLLLPALLLLGVLQAVLGSIGDRSLAYQHCTSACRAHCEDGTHAALALPLRITFWSCSDDCSYECMHNLTDLAMRPDVSLAVKLRELNGLPPNRVVQYHGKWPFYRFMGIQEPMSVLFSAGNLYMHAKYGLSLARQLPSDLPKALQRPLSYIPYAGINLWIWSMVFHTRDKPWTEKLDYFSAALSILFNLYYAIVRIGGLYRTNSKRDSSRQTVQRQIVAAIIGTIFACHVSYLTFWKFDYGYNMAFNVSIGLTHNLFWLGWTIYQFTLPPTIQLQTRTLSSQSSPVNHRAPHYLRPTITLTILSSLIALELLDFPPIWRCLDAHALWHAATIPVIKWWYECLLIDAWWLCGGQAPRKINKARS